MSQPAATVTVVYEDADGQRTSRQYEARLAAVTDAQAIALADDAQALTQLSVVDLLITRRVTGFTPTAAETNSAVAETATIRAQLESGAFHSLNLPAVKAGFKSGKNINGAATEMITFLGHFDNGDGVQAAEGNFFVSDKEKLSELFIEAGNVEGKVNK